MRRFFVSVVVGATVSAAGMLAMVACSGGGAPENGAVLQDDPGGAGSLTFAMTAVGPDGATYWVPANTSIQILPATDGGAALNPVVLNSNVVADTFSLPVGSYGLALTPPTAPAPDAGSTWTLVRKDDAGLTNVKAYLVETAPIPVTVQAGLNTPVQFHFLIPTLGTVTFSTGMLATSTQLDAGVMPPSSGQLVGTVLETAYTSQGTGVDSLFSKSAGSQLAMTATLSVTGPFKANTSAACAPIQVTATSATVVGDAGVTGTNATALLGEMIGTTGTACVTQNGATSGIQVVAARTGKPLTSAFQTALPDAAAMPFNFGFDAKTAATLYDGTTLSLPLLAKPVTVTSGTVTLQAGATFQFNDVTMTVQLSP